MPYLLAAPDAVEQGEIDAGGANQVQKPAVALILD
jgi:hypothetical protein